MALLAKEKKSLEILRKWTFLNIFVCIKKRRYQIWCARHVSGITFIRYTHNQKIEKPNIFKVFGSK